MLASRFARVRLWVYEADLAERMAKTRENDVYLPGFQLPANVVISHELADCLEGAPTVLSVVPSHLVRDLYRQMTPFLQPSTCFVSATKGLENGTLLRSSEIIRQVLEEAGFEPRIAVISGPLSRARWRLSSQPHW